MGAALLAAGFFLSCATRPRVRAGSGETVPPESGIPSPPPPAGGLLRRVKNNDPALAKYFLQDEEGTITVKAEAEGFEILYDLAKARPAGASRWEVDFSVCPKEGGETRQDVLLWTIPPDEAGILLSLDDNYETQWRRYFDLFDRYGVKVTFFVIGAFSPFCTEALNRGHDIGYHTMNHLNLPRLSREEFYRETLDLDSYREAGIPLRSFAYPFGFSEPWMREALADTFAIQRGFGVRYHVYNRESLAAGYIASISIDNIIYKTDEEFEAALTMMLRTVKFIGGDSVIPLTTHTIADEADWGISPRRLEFLFRSARELDLRFYRFGDF
jgi:hypothetical protein